MKQLVLDHGYVELIESWGSDESVICAARMSTQQGFKGWGPKCNACRQALVRVGVPCGACEKGEAVAGDEKLLRYLWENSHATPFEMAGAVIEVQAPIFVFREWHRHRTQSYNEMSARYAPLPDVNYVPTVERLMVKANVNKQAQGTGEALTETNADIFRCVVERVYEELQAKYEDALANGVPKELARIVLPVGRYSKMRASANLRNWLGFLTLRMASNAQYEIRVYANALHDILATKFPRTLALFDEPLARGARRM